MVDHNGRTIWDAKYDVIQKVKGSNIIQTIQSDRNVIELYTEDMQQIAKKENANLYMYNNYIKLASQKNAQYFTLEGKEQTNKEIFPNNSLFAVSKNGLWGFEDKEGNIKVNARYEAVTEFSEYGFAGIKQNGKWGIVDKEGNILVEPVYEIEQGNIEPEFLGEYYKINYNGDIYYTNDTLE